jgi:hypothetical protein
MSNLENLRAEYRRIRRNVGNKISRVEKQQGGTLAGTQYDPRSPVGHEKKLNSNQLRSAIERMQQFQSRGNQFVGLAKEIVPKSEWVRVNRKNMMLRGRSEEFTSKFADKRFPSKDFDSTAREFQSQYHRRADGHENSPFNIVGFRPKDVTTLSALKRLEARIDKQLKPEFFSEHLEVSRKQLMKGMVNSGEPENAEIVRQLNDEQFALLWYASPVPELTFVKDSGKGISDNVDSLTDDEDPEVRSMLVAIRDAKEFM